MRALYVLLGGCLLLSSSFLKAQTYDLTQGLTLHLPFSATVDDGGTFSHPVEAHGAPVHAVDRHGNPDEAIRLDGGNQYLSIAHTSPNFSNLELGAGDFSIGFWVNKLSSSGSWHGTPGINTWYTGASTGVNEWSMSVGGQDGPSSDRPGFVLASASTNYTIAPPSDNLVIGVWAHLMVVREGGDLRYYFNGELKNTLSIGNIAVDNIPDRDFLVGRIGYQGYNTHMELDDIVMYNRSLSVAEIGELMTYGVTGGQQPADPSEAILDQVDYFDGPMSIGVPHINNDYSLTVKKKILTEGVKVRLHENWPDYVFAEGYDLKKLKEVEQFIDKNGHLPGVPSAKEVGENGFFLENMDATLLQKIEELMLYTIDQNKKIEALTRSAADQHKKMQEQQALVKSLLKRLEKLEKQ